MEEKGSAVHPGCEDHDAALGKAHPFIQPASGEAQASGASG